MTADKTIFLAGKGVEGRRLGVLLVHGLGGTPVEMGSLARRLNRDGATVLCCQLPGHGATEAELVASRWQDWLASLDTALVRLEQTCDLIVAGGLSMGALLAARLAAGQPDRVRGLMLLAPTLWYDGWSIPWYSFLLRLLINTPIGRRYHFVEKDPYGVKDKRIRSMVAQALHTAGNDTAGLMSTPSSAIREMWRLSADLRPRLPAIRQPALVVHAREDDTAGLSNAFHFQRHLGGRVDALILEDSYHLVTVDRQRDLVARRASTFLSALAAAETAALGRGTPVKAVANVG
ncbi:alpha/beta hydrolase [Oleisolibacter albus]|uniref:alpha/beta hydrolase n=1 Tax=Oleisolibacter albus TaxID=2171757 RepID=UPI000DF3AD4D|nr:alpha/beta fold hydrolase [Oleisolibacter albus]